MRSCIYCGKELAPGEKCDCAESVAHRKNGDAGRKAQPEKKSRSERREKKNDYSQQYKYNDPERTRYHTGYTGRKRSSFKDAVRYARTKRRARRAYSDKNGDFGGFWRRITDALRSPVEAVQNPRSMSMLQMIALWALQGAVLWLCMYFIMTHTPRGPFAVLGNLLAFRGIAGYKILAYMLMALVSGAVGGIVLFFLYTGVFHFINRFIFRDRMTAYSSICERLALTAVPFAVAAFAGAVISFISSTSLMILLLCGAAAFVVLTYEALKTQWVGMPSGKVVYAMMLGLFILFTLICYCIRLGL